MDSVNRKTELDYKISALLFDQENRGISMLFHGSEYVLRDGSEVSHRLQG